MNDKQQFYNEFYSALEKAMEPSGGQLHEVTIPKNNVMMKGITVQFPDVSMAPTVYPDFYYDDWRQGNSMGDIVSGIRTELMGTAPELSKFNIHGMNRNSAITHLQAAIVSYDDNKDWLKEVPHERISDLAVFAKWDFGDVSSGVRATAKVTDQLLAHLQLTKEETLKIAKSNTAKSARFEGMDVIMAGMLTDEGMDKELAEAMTMEFRSAPFQVLTNESGIDGAAVIACPEVLKEVQKQIGEDFYILPSSVHEVLIIPKSELDDVEGLRQMVSSINEAEVPPQDRLSDNVYEFDGHSLKLAGVGLTQEHNIADTITHRRGR
ncbi:DUF5688 family protein [Enterocloster sp. OA13]|uniref:DUF5688 family protein n=1 Tax=Enterocloster sp. OA13 TaxID=2914161 RepID=UPI000472EF4A|nr:DUF5688 family protein [Enterocloster sp. OA13]